jgi:hypothetical protein
MKNEDCHINKIKIGAKGAEKIKKFLSQPDCLISNLELTDSSLTSDGHLSIA